MQPDFNHDEDTYECPCCGKTYETYYDGYLKKILLRMRSNARLES